MSEINPSHLHWNGPAEVRLKINLLEAAVGGRSGGGGYCTRMELEPRTASHQRAQQEEENATLSTKSSEEKPPLSKQIRLTSRCVTALEQPQGSLTTEPRPPPTSSKEQSQAVFLQPQGMLRQLCLYPDCTWPRDEPQTDMESRAEGSCRRRRASTGVG